MHPNNSYYIILFIVIYFTGSPKMPYKVHVLPLNYINSYNVLVCVHACCTVYQWNGYLSRTEACSEQLTYLYYCGEIFNFFCICSSIHSISQIYIGLLVYHKRINSLLFLYGKQSYKHDTQVCACTVFIETGIKQNH